MMMELFLPVFSLMIVRSKIFSLRLFLILVEMIITVSSLKVGFWNYLATDDFTAFHQVTVDRRTGDVFVAGRNSLLKLSDTLKPVTQLRTGPVLGDMLCHPSNTNCSRERLVNNDAKILEVDETLNRLLFCGSVRRGLCSVLSLNDLTMNLLDAENRRNCLGSLNTVFAFFGIKSKSSILHVANTYDGRSLNVSAPAISSLSLQAASNSSYWLQPVAAFDFDSSAKSQYVVRYVYGFEHGEFVYFVTVQRQSIVPGDFTLETKLVRVCQNDTNLHSYTELSLSCRQKTSIATFLDVAQAAYLGPVGLGFSKRFGIPANEMVLYVLMTKSRETDWIADPSYGSGLCVFTMTDIRKAFTKAQSDCYQGYGRLLPWISHSEPRCLKDLDIAAHINDSFCGHPLNVGIGSRYPLSTDTNFTTEKYVGTSLAVIIQQGKSVAIIGTADGHLLKVLVDGTHSEPYLVLDIGAGMDNRHPVAADMAFDPTQDHLYVLSGPRISRVPLHSCNVYDDCERCILTADPLHCGWCEDHCSTKDECMSSSWSNNSCPPVIHSCHPVSGPVSGGTRVTISGQNFGNGNQSVEGVSAMVKVAMVDCAIEYHNNTCIVCLTGRSVRGPVEREVKVSVFDLSRTTVNFDIRGSVSTMQEGFAYKVPTVVSIVPLMGPKSGGTQITINGQHLDIGANRSATTAASPCSLVRVTATEIVCNTSAFRTHNSSKFVSSLFFSAVGPVAVSIDGSLLNVKNSVFVYMDDPVIFNVFPRISFLSGGIPVTVTGSNLHVTQSSTLCIKITSEGHVFCSHCYRNENGSSMACRTPNVTSSGPVLPSDKSLEVEFYFGMDGLRKVIDSNQIHHLQNTLHYFLDPVFSVFPGQRGIRQFYDDENYLEIQGNHLNLAATQSDYRVTIGGANCSVTQLTATMLLCRPKKPETIYEVETYKAVQVYVGNLVFAIGSLQYAKRHENTLVIMTAVPVASAICVLTIVLFAIWMCKVCTHHRKSKDRVSFIEVPNAGRIIADIRLDHLENSHLEPIFDAEAWSILLDSNMLIDKDSLTVLDIIGQGHFGCVYRGLIQSEADKVQRVVAVKTLKTLAEDAFVSAVEARKFVDEALRMREFDHPHILRVIGMSLGNDDTPLVILPFMKHGDLLTYLRNEDNNPTVRDLMEFCIQIADGMAYLASLKFVHRDLAARNCMLDDCMQVKVADFGLSRDIYERDYYSSDDRRARMPVKWMALESLEKGIYNIKSDVWSYGVVLWELMTRGLCPYPEVDNWDVVKFLKIGRRLSQPSYCPDALHQTMLFCWHPISSMRPSFSALKAALMEMINSMENDRSCSGPNTTYVNIPKSLDYLVPNMLKSSNKNEEE